MPHAYDKPAMSRVASKSDTTELRFDVDPDIAARIDAILMVDKLRSRAEWLVPVIERALDLEFHRATVLLRCAGINPLDSSGNGTGRES